MLNKHDFTKLSFKTGLLVLALSVGACSSSSPAAKTGTAGTGGGAAGTTGTAGTGGGTGGSGGTAGTGGGTAGTTGMAGSDGGSEVDVDGGSDATTDGGSTPEQTHLQLINASTSGGVAITRAAPKDYNSCK